MMFIVVILTPSVGTLTEAINVNVDVFVGHGSIYDDVNEFSGDSVNDCVEHSFCTNPYGSYICLISVKRRQRNLTAGQFVPMSMNVKPINVMLMQVVTILMAVLHVPVTMRL